MPRALVLLPTSSYRTTDFVAAASALGVELTVASDEDLPLDLGDRFLRVDCTDPEAAAEAIVAFADRTPIDAVVAADDAGVIAAALASERLGLASHSPQAASATRDKLAMRERLAAREVPQPAFAQVTDPHSPPPFGFPLVLKPRSGAASRGVLRADDPDQLVEAFLQVRATADALGESGPLLAEAFVPGDEVAVEGLVTDGDLRVLTVFDKPDAPQGPTFPETLLVTPSAHPRRVLSELERVTGEGVAALGLTHGPLHAEARIDPAGRVHLLEIAARSIGGLCGRSLRFGLVGSSLEELILAAALGREPSMSRQPRAAGVLMIPVEEEGALVEVAGMEDAMSVEGITEIEITIPRGSQMVPLPDGDRYLGFIFATGETPGAVTDSLRTAAGKLDVIVDPLQGPKTDN